MVKIFKIISHSSSETSFISSIQIYKDSCNWHKIEKFTIFKRFSKKFSSFYIVIIDLRSLNFLIKKLLKKVMNLIIFKNFIN